MVDCWDPFAVDEPCAEDAKSETTPAAASPSLGTVSKSGEPDSGKAITLEKEDMDYIAQQVAERMQLEQPWITSLDTKPDLTWHEPACTLDDWRHKDVMVKVGNGIAMGWFNRPEQKNSLQDTIGYGTNDLLYGLHARKDIRVAIFTAVGNMYCAGGDPKAWQSNAARLRGEHIEGDGTVGNRCVEFKELSEERKEACNALHARAYHSGAFRYGPVSFGQLCAAKQWNTWYTLPQFTICLVNGSAMGGGVGCVCCCDYVIAVKKAYFVLSEVKIGVIPATISPYVIRKIGTANAKRFFCAAENLSAARAKEYGIVDEVVDSMKAGHARIQEIVKMISESAPLSVEGYKNLIAGVSGVPHSRERLQYTTRMQAGAADCGATRAGLKAAAANQPPDWVGKPIGFDEWPMIQ